MKKYVSILMALLVLWSAAVPEIRADATEAASYGETVVYTDETGESSEERVEIEVPGLPDTGIIGDSETEEDTSEDDTSLPGEDEDYTDTTTENPEEDTTDSDGGYVFPVEPTTSGEDPTTSDEDPTTS
ncbi:MAG: hypothetical protein LUE29_02395, partial [Lachnospiraceae bacterium]|nr:hypothetical protein [Lachnospiraceae bacterium]